jgi:hypothetical protein
MIGVVLVLAALAVAQTVEEPPVIFEAEEDGLLAGQAELARLTLPPLGLGADLGNACVCVCRQADPPQTERWSYYERSIVSNCQWSGRVCIVDGALGTIGSCTEAPAPLD